METTVLLSVFFGLIRGQSKNIENIPGFWAESIVFAILIAIIFLLIAWVISETVPYRIGVKPNDARVRLAWFFILGFISFLALFSIFYFRVRSYINEPPRELDAILLTSILIEGLTYFLVGYLLSKIFKFTKFGTIINGMK